MLYPFVFALCVIPSTFANTIAARVKRDPDTATVTLSSDRGTPSQLISGLLYGIPRTPNQIPDVFYESIGANYGRSGGAQLPEKGWIGGVDEYSARFESALSNYRTIRQYGGRHQLLFHDMWGADSLQPADAPFPGDDGNWTSFEDFLDRVISDIEGNNMRDGLDLDIWNEPDNGPFWGRSQGQYLETWSRAYQKLSQALPDCPIVGPSTVATPTPGNQWWTNYLSYISENNLIPDQYSWHLLLNADDPEVDPEQSSTTFANMRSTYNLPERPITLNEFALQSEQTPGGATWYLSRFERNNIRGLRANYNFFGALYDFFAGLLGKPGAGTDQYDANATGYYSNGEWQLYKYYATNMTGVRLATVGTEDRRFEAYGTKDEGSFKIIVGARLRTGTWALAIQGLSSIGLPAQGSVDIRTLKFDFPGGTFGKAGDPTDEGVQTFDYSGDQLTIPVTIDDFDVAYAYELA